MFKSSNLRLAMRLILSLFYFLAGILHIAAPQGFVLITPAFVPWPETVVLITGICEIAGALALLTRRLKRAAAIGLAAYAICVFPANLNHALNAIAVGGIPTSWWYHAPRLMLQPLLIWWPLFAGCVIDWPLTRLSCKIGRRLSPVDEKPSVSSRNRTGM
jgi:uncharacterized membrane protein